MTVFSGQKTQPRTPPPADVCTAIHVPRSTSCLLSCKALSTNTLRHTESATRGVPGREVPCFSAAMVGVQRRLIQVALGRRPSEQRKQRLTGDCTNSSSVGTSTFRRSSGRLIPRAGALNLQSRIRNLEFDGGFAAFAFRLHPSPAPSPCPPSSCPCHYPREATILFAQTGFLLYNPACLFLTGRYATPRKRRKKELTVGRSR